jgi:hypothetical protein
VPQVAINVNEGRRCNGHSSDGATMTVFTINASRVSSDKGKA